MIYLISLLIFIIGCCFGSFMGVLNDRLNSDGNLNFTNLLGRSKCDNCHKTLTIFQLIPILSILFSRFRCHFCKSKISIRYLLYETSVGIIFLTVFLLVVNSDLLNLQNYLTFGFITFNLSLFYLIFLADYKFQVIPNFYVLVGTIFTLVYSFTIVLINLYNQYFYLKNDKLGKYLIEVGFFKDQVIYNLTPLVYTILGAILIYLFFYFLYAITKGRGMGGGDVKLSFYISVFLGFPQMFIGTFLAFVIGAVFGVILIILNKKQFGQRIAFGPFIIIATVITYFLGDYILSLLYFITDIR